MMKMLIRNTTVEPPNEVDDLWGDEFWYITLDLNDLEESLDIPKSEVSATVVRATGVLLDQ